MKNPAYARWLTGIFLALLFVLTSLSAIGVSAQDAPEISKEDAYLLEKLEALGVIDVVYDNPDMTVTKRQMAEIIVRFMNISVEGVAQGKTPFVDVSPQDPAIDELVALYQAGVISGDENFYFYPDNPVTYNEALVFIIHAVGHKLFAVRNGGYPEGYLRVAMQLELLSDVKISSGKDAATLRDIYKMLEEALLAGAVVEGSITSNSVEYYVSETENFLSSNYGIRTYQGLVTGNENTHLKDPASSLNDEQIAIDGVVYDTPGYVYADSLGKAVRYYVRDLKDGTTEIAYVEENEKKNTVTTIDAEDIVLSKTTLTSLYYTDENGKDKHIDFDDNITVIYNGKAYRGFGHLKNVLPETGFVETLDNTGDGVCEILFVHTYRNIVVAAVDSYSGTITPKGAGQEKITVDPTDKDTRLYMHPENRKTDLSKVRVGDVATVMESKGTPKLTTIYISREKVSGMITEYSEDLGYKINGAYYELAKDYMGPALKTGAQLTFCLDINGDIVDVDASKVDTTAAIGLVTGLDYDFSSVKDSVSLRLYTQDDTFATYSIRFPVKIDNAVYEKKDVNTVLDLLSGGMKDEKGTYYVRDVYVVQYQLNSGEISSICTGNGGSNIGQLRIIAEGNSFFVRNGKMLGLEGASPSGYASFVPGKTLIFTCPSSGELDEVENYSILDKLTSDKEYTNSVSQYYQIAIDGYVLYDYNNNEAKVAEIILLKGKAPQGAEALSNGSSIGVVTKFTSTVTAEGDVTKKVYTNVSDSAVFDDTFLYKKGKESVTLSAASDLSAYVHPGDVIRYGTNAKGLVESIEILTSYDQTNGFTKHFAAGSALGSSNAGSNLVSGYVKYNDTKNGVIVFTASADGTGTEYMVNAEAPRVICYHGDNEKASEENVSVIAPGDSVVIRVESYYKAAEIVVCR